MTVGDMHLLSDANHCASSPNRCGELAQSVAADSNWFVEEVCR